VEILIAGIFLGIFFLTFVAIATILYALRRMKMPDRTMAQTLDDIGDAILDELDELARAAHARYWAYRPEDLIELDVRAQAACTYCHMLADADRRYLDRPGIRPLEIRGLKVWLLEIANVVFRLKKMDEDGKSRNYPTRQAQDYDAQRQLPGLPLPPVRLTAGYWLDPTGQNIIRTQIARPDGRRVPEWCAAIVPREERTAGERIWIDVTRQPRFGRP
jgi:hypothetical protein